MLKVHEINRRYPSSNLWTGKKVSEFFRRRDTKILETIREDFTERGLSIVEIIKKYNFKPDTVRRILKENIKNYKEIVGRNRRIQLLEATKNKPPHLSEFQKERLRNNKNLKISGKRLQKTFWMGKDNLRKEVGYLGYKRVLKKYGKEHFSKLGLKIKMGNDYELLVKRILRGKKVKYHYYRNGCIPDFYKKNSYLLEVTKLYPLRSCKRVEAKIKQLQKYKKNFKEKIYLVTPHVIPWKRCLKERGLNIKVINEIYVKSPRNF
jgi:hypothetical protein